VTPGGNRGPGFSRLLGESLASHETR